MLLAELFLSFAKVGLFTFGGGYAMISMIEHEVVEKKQWISHDDMMNITVVAESTPGPIAINCATYVGYKKSGLAGALTATLGMIMPSFIIIYLISLYFSNFLEIVWFAKAFKGISLAVGILILDAAFGMIKKMQKKPLPRGIMIGACAVMLVQYFFSLRVSSVVLMLVCGLISLIIFSVKQQSGKKGGNVK